MKEIPIVQFTDTDSTITLLKLALNVAPPGGLDFAAIRGRNRVADAVEKIEKDKMKSGKILKLEDADHAVAVEAIKCVRWNGTAKHLIQFAEQFGL